MNTIDTTTRPRRPALGLPILAIVGLSLLGAPRIVLHDLDILHEGTLVNLLFVVIPPVVWIIVALRARVPNPFVTLLAIGACYGVQLALVHQLLWDQAFGADGPTLGGELATVDPGAQDVVVRAFAVVSSLFTGVAVGAVCGLVTWALSRALSRAVRRVPQDR